MVIQTVAIILSCTLYRQAFFTKSKADAGRKEWMKSINQSIGTHSLYTHATDSQISAYLMRKVEEFYTDDENPPSSKEVASVMGLQPCDGEGDREHIWVLNAEVHINEDGQLIPPHTSPYIWLASYTSQELASLPTFEMASLSKPSLSSEALLDLVQALQDVHQENLPAALMMLGAQVLCCHYERIITKAGQVPAVVAFGDVSLGKSKATEAAQSLLGLPRSYRPSKITDTQGIKLASQTTMGYMIDDPSDVNDVAEKILVYFEKGSYVSRAGTYEPKCTFL